MTTARRAALLFAWIATILVAGVYAQRNLEISGDLRLFMPTPRTPVEHLLLQEIGEGPASRLLLLALEGADTDALAASSRRLAAALRGDSAFRWVANGESRPEAVPERMLPYRYLLSSTLDTKHLDTPALREALAQREQDLASPAASLLEPWIARDPTLETLKLIETWEPERQPQVIDDVWFDEAGHTALLVVETAAAAFDPQGQRLASERLTQHFEATRASPAVRLIASGPGAFSVLMQKRTEDESRWIGVIDTAGLIILLLIAYRTPRFVVLGILPLASAGVAGLAAVGAAFGQVHGITIAFGFTLIGVAQDYPIHLFSHRHPGASPLATAKAVWPTLATGVASTCIAYLAFLASGVTGLRQLACFTIVGLAVAAVTTRYMLPLLLTHRERDYGDSPRLERWWAAIARAPHPRAAAWVAAGICLAIIALVPGPFWQNDLGRLTPVPAPLLQRDATLRAQLGAPDVRYLLAVDGHDAQAVLERLESLEPALDALVARGAIDGYDFAPRYLPSALSQERRRAALPEPQTLRADIRTAAASSAFRPEIFEAFVTDVERARELPPLLPGSLRGTPLELRVAGLLLRSPDHWTGLVTFVGVHDARQLATLARGEDEDRGGGVHLLDLKQASEDLVARQRDHILESLAIAAFLLVAVVWIALRSIRRARRVLAPMALTTLLILAILHGSGTPLTLFHLIALVLAAGLGLDYALFFEHASHDPVEQRRTLHAVIVCSLTTLLVFAVLASSSLPVLSAIGVTVSLGVIGNFVLALLLTRRIEESA